jgi:hypothetical protein
MKGSLTEIPRITAITESKKSKTTEQTTADTKDWKQKTTKPPSRKTHKNLQLTGQARLLRD